MLLFIAFKSIAYRKCLIHLQNVVEMLKQYAHRNIVDLVPGSGLCNGHIPRPLGSLETQPAYNQSLDVQSLDFEVAHQSMKCPVYHVSRFKSQV